jgi:hypothetical protein
MRSRKNFNPTGSKEFFRALYLNWTCRPWNDWHQSLYTRWSLCLLRMGIQAFIVPKQGHWPWLWTDFVQQSAHSSYMFFRIALLTIRPLKMFSPPDLGLAGDCCFACSWLLTILTYWLCLINQFLVNYKYTYIIWIHGTHIWICHWDYKIKEMYLNQHVILRIPLIYSVHLLEMLVHQTDDAGTGQLTGFCFCFCTTPTHTARFWIEIVFASLSLILWHCSHMI